MGFDVNNEPFSKHSWYFRNALVRANYSNPLKGVSRDYSFLEKFFCNLLLGENNELKNRYMVICLPAELSSPDKLPDKLPDNLIHKLDNMLYPAMNEGFIRMLHPDSPRHPRQKYLLTVKGLGLYNKTKKQK